MDKNALGRRIREERLKLKLTQEQLAEDVDLSSAYIGQVERGERSLTLERLISVVNRLGVSVDYLLSDSVQPEDDNLHNLWLQLFSGRQDEEKHLAINMIKLMFEYLDKNNT